MRLFLQDNNGNMLATSIDGQLYMHNATKEQLGFMLFQMMWQVMAVSPGSHAAVGTDIRVGSNGIDDIEGGTP